MTIQRGVAVADPSTVADKLAIQELLGQYSFTYDAGDLESWFNLWTDDGSFEVYMPTRSDPILAASGRDELMEVITTTRAGGDLPVGLCGFHLQSLTVFDDLTPESARIRTMVHATVQTCDDDGRGEVDAHTWHDKMNSALLFAGVYHSELAKIENHWLFRKRVFVADMRPTP